MKLFIGFLSILCVVIIEVFFIAPSAQGQKSQVDEPTIVQKGQVTQEDHEYTNEFRQFYSSSVDRKLSELSKLGNDKGLTSEIGVFIFPGTRPGMRNEPVISSLDFFRNISCLSDAVVMGSVKKKTARLTEDETFVYTNYAFSVNEILKNNPKFQIEPNASIHIARPGGLIKLDNQLIRVEGYNHEPLNVATNYLLFLRHIPTINGYVISSYQGDFVVDGNSLKSLSTVAVPDELRGTVDRRILLNKVREAVSLGCQQTSNGGGLGFSRIQTAEI